MVESKHPPPVVSPPRSLLETFFRQTQTRILLLYVVLLGGLTGLAIPLFHTLISDQVSKRVRGDLIEAREIFQRAYLDWERKPNQNRQDLEDFADKFLANQLPEDDNFFIFIINGEFYRSNPPRLLDPMQPGSQLFQKWASITKFDEDQRATENPEIGNILYKAKPLMVDGHQMGVKVLAHATAGEQNEALSSVNTFMFVEVVVVSISFLLAWFITRRLLKPVRQLAFAARQINESDLTRRLSPQGTGELADLAQTFNTMMDRLEESFNGQRRFVNDAGHELRTPITIVRGHLELMADDPQEQRETIELVLDELDRMGRLVNDMIALATAERPDFLQYERIDLKQFMNEIFTKAQALADRNWQVKLECSDSMMGDRQRLTGALLNLLRNAAQYTSATGTIELGCKQTLTQVIFWVKDNGSGISPENQLRIFDRFARLGKRQSEGSGLGLAIVKAFTEAHRGKIDLVSQLGIGSTFTITLPLSAQNNTVV
ncbi:HAMP domain-containing sensor histidine kinase [Acaryochloris sp. IP29b_bin.137]|uniref:sensor histidine kinase n=1 Tax=Acaryochloris sp. IP29b_bin.137 TaxID=2969217 RepID=UPI00262B1E2D|nr:HAMP domain-containing sensor histidine kinase [Acaryochloris sp. IP29b_bin.137]